MVVAMRELQETAPEGLGRGCARPAGHGRWVRRGRGTHRPAVRRVGPRWRHRGRAGRRPDGLRDRGPDAHRPTHRAHGRGCPPTSRARSSASSPGSARRTSPWTSGVSPASSGACSQDHGDPVRRGPPLRLGRPRDRTATRGARRRARRSPRTPSRSSSPAIAWCAPTGTSASTAPAVRRPSGRCWRRRASTRTSSSDWPAGASDTSARTPRASSATRRAGTPGGVTERHRVTFRSGEDARAAGFRACPVCRPLEGAVFAA